MTQEETLEVIAYHQKWRKGGDVPQIDPAKLTEALDSIRRIIESKDREIAELDEQLQLQHDLITELKAYKEMVNVVIGSRIERLKITIERTLGEENTALRIGCSGKIIMLEDILKAIEKKTL